MKINKKTSDSTGSSHSLDWVNLALEAIKLSFDENHNLDPNKEKNYKNSISLFEQSFKSANQAWPFLKCADLYSDLEERTNLYLRSFEIEKTNFACIKLIEIYLNNSNYLKANEWLNILISIDPSNIYIDQYEELIKLNDKILTYEVTEPKFVERDEVYVDKKAVKVISFYLPQFHQIPENDKWWGKGFTEWTNVKSAVPQFEGHYQPHIPHQDIGYYNLLNKETQAKHIDMAKQYGIEGFCYYLYWFSGKRLLEQPLDNMLSDPSLDFPFCVCWANENWSRRWDGLDKEILMFQDYSEENDIKFIEDVSKYLVDPRYIRIDGKPLLLIYRPNLFPNIKKTVSIWRRWCSDNNVGDIYLAYTQSFSSVNPAEFGFDAAIEFPPLNWHANSFATEIKPIVENYNSKVYDWRFTMAKSDYYEEKEYKLFRGLAPSWDNTPRLKNNGTVFYNSCPNLFKKWLINAFKKTLDDFQNPDEQLVFINAWNEWAEGAHLEPDQKYGYAWLNSIREAHKIIVSNKKRILLVTHDAMPHGAQMLLLNIARTLCCQLSFDVSIISLGRGPLLKKYSQYSKVFVIEDLSEKKSIEILKKLKDSGINSAIVNTTVSGVILPILKEMGFYVVTLVHELPVLLKDYNLNNQALKIEELADQIVFPNIRVKEGFEEFIGKKVHQFKIRPQGIYHQSTIKDASSKKILSESVRNRLGIPIDSKIIMCVGYADRRKGFDYFVQVCSELILKDPSFYALWVGHWDKPFVDQCMQVAKSKGTENNFLFTGFVDDPREYYAAADVYALTSREDPFPSVVVESLDALTPVVAFRDCGGFEDLLRRDCGVLVPKGDLKAYADSIESLLLDSELSYRLGLNGRKIVQSELNFYHYLFDLLDYAKETIPRISVVVPNYNYAKYIINRLDSIINQTFPIYEIVVLDDASTDDSIKLIEEYFQECKIPWQLVTNEQNSGSVFKQWKKGAELVRGDYLWIAEADDSAEPEFVETLIKFFNDTEVVLAYSQSKQIDHNNNLLSNNYLSYTSDIGDYWNQDYVISGDEEIRRALCFKNTILNVSSVLFKKNDFLNLITNKFSLICKFKVAGDWFIYSELIKNKKLAFSSKSLNVHRRHYNSMTHKNDHSKEVFYMQCKLQKKRKILVLGLP